MTKKDMIRKELNDVRYYYWRKDKFVDYVNDLGVNFTDEIAEKYNTAIRTAPPRLYDLYIALYLNNNTHESLAEKWGYSVSQISRLNCMLVNFFAKYFEKEGSDV